MKRLVLLLGGLLTVAACADTPASDPLGPGDGPALRSDQAEAALSRTYEIEITNLTDSQPLTPPLIATHQHAVRLFREGRPASFGLKEIAENGNLAPLHMELEGSPHVSDVAVAVAGDPPPLLPGQQVTATLEATGGARFISFVSMLICTNDGFTGTNARLLPLRVGDEAMLYGRAWDAGTEINTEDFADLVPPCPVLTGVMSSDPGTGTSDPALAENGVVHPHAGIQGIADLSVGVHGWEEPVVRVLIRRID